MAWSGVSSRFRRFEADLLVTPFRQEDANTKQHNVRRCLEATYYGCEYTNPPGFVVGSWGKRTQIRPSSDIDVLFPLPISEKSRFDAYAGNSQSILLQEVKNILATRYSSSDLRGDGQVVQIRFNSIMVEVIPVFPTSDDYRFLMPNTHNGGSWKPIWPTFERVSIEVVDTEVAGNVVSLARMMKHWKRLNEVDIKSYLIEILVTEFLKQYNHRFQKFFYFDWFVRDFLGFLMSMANRSVYSPGSGEFINLGGAWLSKAHTAYDVATEACELEREDFVTLAGLEWAKIFGNRIPVAI